MTQADPNLMNVFVAGEEHTGNREVVVGITEETTGLPMTTVHQRTQVVTRFPYALEGNITDEVDPT